MYGIKNSSMMLKRDQCSASRDVAEDVAAGPLDQLEVKRRHPSLSVALDVQIVLLIIGEDGGVNPSTAVIIDAVFGDR